MSDPFAQDLERRHLRDLVGEVPGNVMRNLLHRPPGREKSSANVGNEPPRYHLEDQVLGQVLGRPPDHPAETRVDQPVLIECTRLTLKSHSSSGCRSGAMKPPEAAST